MAEETQTPAPATVNQEIPNNNEPTYNQDATLKQEMSHVQDLEKSRSDSDEITGSRDGTSKEAEADPIRWSFARVVAFISLCFVYCGSLIIPIFNSGALSYMARDLNTTVPNWILSANTLSLTAVVPFVGYITDLLGRRNITILGSVLIIVFSAVMGTAKSLAPALVAQALGGIGAGICELTALAGIAEITPVKSRGLAVAALVLITLPFAPNLLYIVKLEEADTWRWSYLIVGLWNVIGLIGLVFCYHPPPRHNVDGLTRMEIVKRIDYVGGLLSIGGITLFLVAIQAGGYQYAWTDARVLAPLIIGIIMIVLFPLWEWKGAKYPMVPGAIFRGQRVVAICYILGFIGGLYFYSVLGIFPLILQKVWVSDSTTLGIRSLGVPFATIGIAVLANAFLAYSKGHVRGLFFFGATVMTAFAAALSASTVSDPTLGIAMVTCCAIGIGIVVVPTLTLALYACPDRYLGTTAALSLAVRFLGASIGISIFFNILQTKVRTVIPELIAPVVVPLGLPADAIPSLIAALNDPKDPVQAAAKAVLAVVPDPGKAIQILVAAAPVAQAGILKCLTYVWYGTIPFGVIAMGTSLFLPNIREYMTDRVAVRLG